MSVTGVVTNPASPNTSSATLLTDVSSGATVLPVDDAGVFAEDFSEARFLVIGAEQTPREYVAVQNDEDDPAGESVTLKDPVGGSGFEAGLTVTTWDANAAAIDKRGVEFNVWVQPDGASAPVSATVPHQWLPTSGDLNGLQGARVQIEETSPDDWAVSKVFGRQAVLSSEFHSLALRGRGGKLFQETEDGRTIYVLGDVQNGVTGAALDDDGACLFMGINDVEPKAFQVAIFLPGSPSAPDGLAVFDFYGDYATFTSPLTVTKEFQANAAGRVIGGFDVDSLGDGGFRNTNSGTKYVRAGAEGKLYSSTTAPSSRTIKHDIADLDLDPQTILSLRPVTYRYNEAPDTVRAGFIAEEAHDAGLGLFVGYEDHDDPEKPTGFDYDGITAGLVAVVQQQNERIERLERLLADRAEDARHGD